MLEKMTFEVAVVIIHSVFKKKTYRWMRRCKFLVVVGPYDRYKCSYGAPINGRKYMGNWGDFTLLIGVITPLTTSRGPTLWLWYEYLGST